MDNQLYAVRDVTGGSWVIDVAGQTKTVSARSGPISIKIAPKLKLTEVSATIANLKSDRGYTIGNDPTALMTRNLAQTAVENADYNNALNQATAVQSGTITATQMGINNITPFYGPSTPANRPPSIQAALNTAQQGLNAAAGGIGADYSMGGRNQFSQGFDAMDVEFEISSARPLRNPYAVTVTRFRPQNGRPDMVQYLVYARALDTIDSHPTKVHFVQGGFPFNFELVGFQLHIYDRGEEVATNVSSKRVELTREEAFEYVKSEYIGAHKGETLPAVPVMGKLPADLPGLLAAGKYGETIYVRVSKDGLGDEPFLDTACTRRIEDPYLQSVIRGIRFKPALEQGKPVDGVAALNLGKMVI
jgi:hypothetical protein